MKKKRKGQVALEFLMTYGWAFLIILVVIGAFIYFDVLNPSRQISGRCMLNPGLHCNAYELSAGTENITLEVRNDLGEQINITNASITGTLPGLGNSTNCAPGSTNFIPNGGLVLIACEMDPDDMVLDERYQGNIEINYVKRGSSLEVAHPGTISGTITS